MLATELGVRPNYVQNVEQRATLPQEVFRKSRSEVTCLDVVKSIQIHYRDAAISRELPLMRVVKKNLKPRRVMDVSVQRAYDMLKERQQADPDHMCSFSVFAKLRPDDVLLQRRQAILQCLREYCTDVMLKLHTLNHVAAACGRRDLAVKDKYALVSSTVCRPDDGGRYARPSCIHRTCQDCGVSRHDDTLNLLIQAHTAGPVTWKKRQSIVYQHNQVSKSKKVLQLKSGSLKEMVTELLAEVDFLARHLFVANWQQDMFNMAKQLPFTCADTVVIVLDFAENYGCFHQDEIQSAHWAVNQVTVHPLVCYYSCSTCEVRHVIQEAFVVISDHLKHDGHAVQHFTTLAMTHLRGARGVTVNRLVEFTDGCAGQYKSKQPFCDITFAAVDFHVARERHYFGSRHGKGPSDRVSGVVKSAVRRAVVGRRAVIDGAATMYTYLDEGQLLGTEAGFCVRRRW